MQLNLVVSPTNRLLRSLTLALNTWRGPMSTALPLFKQSCGVFPNSFQGNGTIKPNFQGDMGPSGHTRFFLFLKYSQDCSTYNLLCFYDLPNLAVFFKVIRGVGGCASGLNKRSQATLPASNIKMGLLEQFLRTIF